MAEIPEAILNDPVAYNKITNGLAGALGYSDFQAQIGIGGGFPQNQGVPWSEPVSQSTPLFTNLRWYLVSNFRQLLNELYVEIGLIQTVVDVPVDDAMRGGIIITSKQLDQEDIAKLQAKIKTENDLKAVSQTAKWNRLFGGAGVLVLTNQDPKEPLDLDEITEDEPVKFVDCDMWELFWTDQNTQLPSPFVEKHEGTVFYNYYGQTVHHSRVFIMKGVEAPSFIRPRLRGWGFSIVESIVRSINQAFKSVDLAYEVLDEFKIDVLRLKNLANSLLSKEGESVVRQRVQLLNWFKNYQNSIVMDSEDEYLTKQISFTGIAEMMQEIRHQIASDLRIPQTKLFGQSSAGFNSGEDDIEIYNSMVEGQVRNKIEFITLEVVKIRCQQLFGIVPDDLAIEFKPLRVLSSEQEEKVKDSKMNRLVQAMQANAIDFEEFREACNMGKLFDIPLKAKKDMMSVMAAKTEAVGDMASGVGGNKAREEDGDELDDEGQESDFKLKNTVADSLGPTFFPEPYSEKEIKKSLNSRTFDLKYYEAAGGDKWIDPRRQELFVKPSGVNGDLWDKARRRSLEIYGEERWQFIAFYYKKLGGRFGH